MNDKYEKIINIICNYNGIDKNSMFNTIKMKHYKYLILLLLEKYNCTQIGKFKQDFSIDSMRKYNYSLKKAKQEFFINKNFRNKYFEIEDRLKKSI